MQTITIAIVEDDVELAEELVFYLQYQGMVVAFLKREHNLMLGLLIIIAMCLSWI